ncbi:response regulator [Flavobacteriaceae bacterium TK19130]|nr:response regulator [Thermobacterium salinum]
MTTPPVKLACVIDDDNVYVNLVKKVVELKKLCEKLLIFRNGKEALDYFSALYEDRDASVFPELILLDLNMPVMNGWDFLQNFSQVTTASELPGSLYIVSSSDDVSEIDKAKSYGLVSDYLIKPLNLMQFENLFFKRVSA